MADLAQKAMFDYLNERIFVCGEEWTKLKNDHRDDEATFEKIKANIYEIFSKMLSVAIKKSGGNGRALRAFFGEKLEEIPSSWAASYEKAALHGDVKTMHIEKMKLDVVQEIKAARALIWEEEE